MLKGEERRIARPFKAINPESFTSSRYRLGRRIDSEARRRNLHVPLSTCECPLRHESLADVPTELLPLASFTPLSFVSFLSIPSRHCARGEIKFRNALWSPPIDYRRRQRAANTLSISEPRHSEIVSVRSFLL